MSNREIFDEFMVVGGTELSPMSCTADLAIALKYSQGPSGTINTLLWVRTENFMDRGVDLQWRVFFFLSKKVLFFPFRKVPSTVDFW